MNKKEELENFLHEKYFNQRDNYNNILNKIQKSEQIMMKRKHILGLVASICIVILGTTGLAFASTKIFENKKLATIKLADSVSANKDGDVLEKCSSLYNVDISVEEISNKGLRLIINDKNDVHYTYPNHYEIRQKVKSDKFIGTNKVYR